MKKQRICYRFVKDDLTSKNGVMKWEIGKWNKVKGKLKCCKNGLHASLTPLDSLNNVYGDKWFIAEYKGKIDEQEDKFCASEMRLIKEIPIEVIKRFALFCAKSCLKNYEKEYPDDKRVSECIRITELYLDGKATIEELNAAESAAWKAAWSAESAAKRGRSAAKKRQNKELLKLIKSKKEIRNGKT